jgi:2-octaprenyl-6-methoxyphenol hydroxylase
MLGTLGKTPKISASDETGAVMKNDVAFDAGVVGAGPAGLAAALCLARSGLRVAVVGAAPARADNRTAALFTGSVQLLRNLGAWPLLEESAEPIVAIRIVDDMGGLLRAPECLFTAAEVGLEAFGYNIPNQALVSALRLRIAAAGSGVSLIEAGSVAHVEIGSEDARLGLPGRPSVCVQLVVGADGRNSLCRTAAGIGTHAWSYDQSALTCAFAHQRPHAGISTEFHRQAGPFTVVPSPACSSSLVWVERPAAANRLAGLDDEAFRGALETHLQGLLGTVGELGPRSVFPLSGLTAEVAGKNRVALVGEAAHVVPPIGAQGLNLGLRDAAMLADCAADALAAARDIGGAQTLEAYSRSRKADIASRAWSIDLLNRSLLSGFMPVQLARGFGLHALKAVGPLRRFAIREGLEPSFIAPRLMQAGFEPPAPA